MSYFPFTTELRQLRLSFGEYFEIHIILLTARPMGKHIIIPLSPDLWIQIIPFLTQYSLLWAIFFAPCSGPESGVRSPTDESSGLSIWKEGLRTTKEMRFSTHIRSRLLSLTRSFFPFFCVINRWKGNMARSIRRFQWTNIRPSKKSGFFKWGKALSNRWPAQWAAFGAIT